MKNLLKNWEVKKTYWTDELVLFGQIYNDEKKRFADGELITTSPLVETNFAGKVVNTRNTTYNLE